MAKVSKASGRLAGGRELGFLSKASRKLGGFQGALYFVLVFSKASGKLGGGKKCEV